ncbi:hypothetical protein GCM10010305_63240 [Streptomyces termitum]|uniref:Uncharacterized protein n=1 Tax=Streptomyces termitum TaxID=67368 RepID=A0A918WD86_9ACTN|nr:hypothetical protein GCM10010305_63240 [Streptomyces termitum]
MRLLMPGRPPEVRPPTPGMEAKLDMPGMLEDAILGREVKLLMPGIEGRLSMLGSEGKLLILGIEGKLDMPGIEGRLLKPEVDKGEAWWAPFNEPSLEVRP